MSDFEISVIIGVLFTTLVVSIWYASRSLKGKKEEGVIPPLPIPEKTDYKEQELAILFEINQVRKSLGLKILALNDAVSIICESHIRNVIRFQQPLSHEGVGQRFTEIKEMIPYVGVAEILAYGYRTAPAVVRGWVNSPKHYESIVGNFDRMGVSVQWDDEGKSYASVILIR